MNPVALLCSPRPCGTSDALARYAAEGAAGAGCTLQIVPLREYTVTPCTGCGACRLPPHACVLNRGEDQAEELFSLLTQAPMILLAAPIYFYALPAGFKALIDRGQRFWAAQEYAHVSGHTPKDTAGDTAGSAIGTTASKAGDTAGSAGTLNTSLPHSKPALVCLAAGRPRGEHLFSGALLTLTYFLRPLQFETADSRLLRGLDDPMHITPDISADMRQWGEIWGRQWIQQRGAKA